MLLREADRVAAGLDPLGVSHDPDEPVIELAQEANKYGDGAAFLAEALDATHVRYSPLRDQIVELLREPAK